MLYWFSAALNILCFRAGHNELTISQVNTNKSSTSPCLATKNVSSYNTDCIITNRNTSTCMWRVLRIFPLRIAVQNNSAKEMHLIRVRIMSELFAQTSSFHQANCTVIAQRILRELRGDLLLRFIGGLRVKFVDFVDFDGKWRHNHSLKTVWKHFGRRS